MKRLLLLGILLSSTLFAKWTEWYITQVKGAVKKCVTSIEYNTDTVDDSIFFLVTKEKGFYYMRFVSHNNKLRKMKHGEYSFKFKYTVTFQVDQNKPIKIYCDPFLIKETKNKKLGILIEQMRKGKVLKIQGKPNDEDVSVGIPLDGFAKTLEEVDNNE